MTMRPLLMTMRCDLQRGRHAFRPLESRGGLSRSIQFPIRSVNIFQVEREYSRGEQSPRTGIRNGNWGDGGGNTGLAIKGLSGSCQARTSSVIYSESFAAFSVFKADGAFRLTSQLWNRLASVFSRYGRIERQRLDWRCTRSAACRTR